MPTTDLLTELLALLSEKVEGVKFRKAWGPGWGSRLMDGPVVSGEVKSQRWAGSRLETVLRLSVFGPDAECREETVSVLEEVVQANCPGCQEILRGSQQEDTVARLPYLTLELTFLSGDGTGVQGITVVLGGKTLSAASVTVSLSLSGEALIAVGEDTPFAVRDAQTEYQVSLEGVDATGLERMAVFTAEIGNTLYTGCRWKKLDLQMGSAVFVATSCEEKEEAV